jgi:hypothetical protein
MNCDTGHLVTAEFLNQMNEDLRANYTPVPEELSMAATMKLAGKREAMVSLTSGGKLSTWANQQTKAERSQKSKTERHRRQMAKASRRKNRA